MGEKETFAFRLENDTAEEVKEYVDERGVKKSDVLRRATKEYIDEQTGESGGARRSVSPLTILGVVAIAVAPTLLATGYTGLGVASGLVAATYVLLWATAYDVVLERHVDAAREELDEVGGVVAFFQLMWFDHHVEDPNTIIERAARLDLYAPVAGVLAILVGGVAAVLQYLGYLGSVLAAIGPWGAIGWAVLIVALAYLFAVMVAISALASLAIASAATEEADVVDDTVA